jgi:tetratricopeptide (TPR) repeat protein
VYGDAAESSLLPREPGVESARSQPLSNVPSRSQRQFGNYEVVSLVGSGDLAEVFHARVMRGRMAGQGAALKRLHQTLSEKQKCVLAFAEGMEQASAFDHPGIVRVFEAGAVRSVQFEAMEWIEGHSLERVLMRCLERGLSIPVDFGLYIAHALVEALEYAHQASAPHGNVTARSVFITKEGEVKLGDFGWAGVRAAAAAEGLAPPPRHSTSVAGDLWGATATLRQILTLDMESANAASRKVRAMRPQVSREVEALVDRGLSPIARDRFPSAAVFAHELEGLFDPNVGTPLAVLSLIRTLFAGNDDDAPTQLLEPPPLPPAPARPAAVLAPPPTKARLSQPRMEPLAAARALATTLPPPPPAPGEHPVVKPAARAAQPPQRTRSGEHAAKPAAPKRPSRRMQLPANVNVEEHVGNLFSAQGRFLRGLHLLSKGKFKAASKAFEEAIGLAADESAFHAYLGWSRFKADPKNAHAAKDAMVCVDRALELDPDSEKGNFYAGMIHRDTGHRAEAQKAFEKVVQINPDNKEALRQLRKLGRPG